MTAIKLAGKTLRETAALVRDGKVSPKSKDFVERVKVMRNGRHGKKWANFASAAEGGDMARVAIYAMSGDEARAAWAALKAKPEFKSTQPKAAKPAAKKPKASKPAPKVDDDTSTMNRALAALAEANASPETVAAFLAAWSK